MFVFLLTKFWLGALASLRTRSTYLISLGEEVSVCVPIRSCDRRKKNRHTPV